MKRLINKNKSCSGMKEIPIYQVSVPEYKLKVFRNTSKTSKKSNYAVTTWYNVKIPQIYWDNKPDFEKIGAKIDKCLKKHFIGKEVVIRALGSQEHKGKSADELIKIIKKIGHDRYNPARKGDRYENLDNAHIDFFALDFAINNKDVYFKHFLEPFYFWPITDRGEPIRIDIAIVYDFSKLFKVPHRYKGRENELKEDGFVFKCAGNKADAILGIIKIL